MPEKRFAILIDAENISPRYIASIMSEIEMRGTATVKRVYGDWTGAQAQGWKDILLEYSLTPMQQYSYTKGKNSSDSAMIIDAMDILYGMKVDGFCLASSDSDFTKLASRLREAGMTVIGMGEDKTPRPFVVACDEFKYLSRITQQQKPEAKQEMTKKEKVQAQPNSTHQPQPPMQKAEIQTQQEKNAYTKGPQTDISVICSAIKDILSKDALNDDGWMLATDISQYLLKRYPDFDVRNYGYSKLILFLKSFDLFEVDAKLDPNNHRQPHARIIYVRLKNTETDSDAGAEQRKKAVPAEKEDKAKSSDRRRKNTKKSSVPNRTHTDEH